MIETLIVPGLNGSPEGHWQHHWAMNDAAAELVDQESWSRPVFAEWLSAPEARIMAAGPGVVLVAHSLGCILVAALAARSSSAHVSGALLVAPADAEPLSRSHPAVRSFVGKASRRLPFASLVVASRNDPFMSFERAERQTKAWGAGLYDLGNAGHINIATGYGPWPDAAILADGLRGRTSAADVADSDGDRWWNSVRPEATPSHGSGLGVF